MAAILSHVETRHVANDYPMQFESQLYQIDRKDIRAGLRGATVRVEKRLDGTLAVRFRDRYLTISACQGRPARAEPAQAREILGGKPERKPSDWNKNFDLKNAPKIWPATRPGGLATSPISSVRRWVCNQDCPAALRSHLGGRM